MEEQRLGHRHKTHILQLEEGKKNNNAQEMQHACLFTHLLYLLTIVGLQITINQWRILGGRSVEVHSFEKFEDLNLNYITT